MASAPTKDARRPAFRPSSTVLPVGAFSLKYLAEILQRRKRLMPLPILLTPVLAALLSYTIAPSYMSTTTIALEKSEILNPLVRYDTAVSLTDWNRLGLFQKVIYSRPVMEEVIRRLELDTDILTEADLEKRIDEIRNNIHLLNLSGDSFQIGCSASDPVAARDLVKTVSSLFIEKSLEGSRREASVAVDFIRQQVAHYREQLKLQQDDLERFKTDNLELLSQSGSLGSRAEDHRTKRMEAELELEQALLTEKLLEDQLVGESPMVIAQALFVQNTPYKRRYQELKMELGHLLATREESHDDVVRVRRELKFIENMIAAEKNNREADETREVRSPVYQEILARLNDKKIDVKVLIKKVEAHGRLESELREKLRRLPTVERHFEQLQRDIATTTEVYNQLMLKLEHARVSHEVEIAAQANRFRIIDPPLVPLLRYKPIRKVFVVGGVAGGLVIVMTLVFTAEFLDSRILRTGELTGGFGLPIVGEMPKVHRKTSSGAQRLAKLSRFYRLDGILAYIRGKALARQLVLPPGRLPGLILGATDVDAPDNQCTPGCRGVTDIVKAMRTVVLAMTGDRDRPRVVAIASARSEDGKSVVAGNLAVVAANNLSGPVLVVDVNFQRPTLSRHFGAESGDGLAEVLAGKATLAQVVRPTDVPNLFILPAGTAEGQQASRSRPEGYAAVFKAVRAAYALTLVDTAGVMNEPQTQAVLPGTDGALFVARLYWSRRASIKAAFERVGKARISGFIANNTEFWLPEWLYRLV